MATVIKIKPIEILGETQDLIIFQNPKTETKPDNTIVTKVDILVCKGEATNQQQLSSFNSKGTSRTIIIENPTIITFDGIVELVLKKLGLVTLSN